MLTIITISTTMDGKAGMREGLRNEKGEGEEEREDVLYGGTNMYGLICMLLIERCVGVCQRYLAREMNAQQHPIPNNRTPYCISDDTRRQVVYLSR